MIDCHFHVKTQDSSTPEGRADRARQVRRVADRVGVERVCLIGYTGSNPEESTENNQLVGSFVSEHPDIFFGWARVNPTWGKDAVTEFRRAVEEDGLIGLKLYADTKLDDPAVDPLAEAAVEMDVPIISHIASRTETYERKALESGEVEVRNLAERFPDLKLISGHIGGGGQWERRIKHIAPVDNVYLDTSGSVTQAGQLEMAVEYLGADRVVFGTDTWFLSGLGKLRGADLSAEDKAQIGYNMNDLLSDDVENKLSATEVEEGQAAAADRFEELARPHEAEIIDANAYVGRYQFRRVDGEPDELIAQMDRRGVDRAVVSSFASLLYKNPHTGNEELAEAVAGHEDRLISVATLNPTYPAWEADLEEAVQELGMRGVKLVPAHHDYDLGDEGVVALLDRAVELDIPVIIAGALEDQRGRHPRVEFRGFEGSNPKKRWSRTQVDGLISALEASPDADVIVANIRQDSAARVKREVTEDYASGPSLQNLVREGATLFVADDMRVYWPNDAAAIIAGVGPEHLVCGPRLPMRVFDAHHHVQHMDLADEEADAIRAGNLKQLFDV